MQHEQIRLNNQLETLFVNSPGSPSASVQIWFRAGSALEQESNEGIAHFLEHMFFKGTPKRPGAAIAHEVESFGGEINAFTSFDYTCYYINTPSSHLNQTVNILLDMVSNPTFKQDDLIPEREVVYEEYRRSQDSPNHYSFHRIQGHFFKNGYAHPILGNEQTIKNFSQEQLHQFRNAHYNLSNALLVVAGDLKDRDQISKTIEGYQLPEGPSSRFPLFELKEKSSTEVHQKDVRMAQLTICCEAPEFSHEHAATEDVALNCLGLGETSRLHKDLVIRDSIANATSCTTMFMSKGGIHFVRLTFPYNNIKIVFNRLEKILKDVYSNGFSKEEIQKIKNQYIASKVYEMESLESYAFTLGHGYAQTGDIKSDEEFIARVKKVSKVATNKSIRDILSRPLHFSLQTPKDINQQQAKSEVNKLQKLFSNFKKGAEKKSSDRNRIKSSKYDPQLTLYKLKKGINLLHRKNPMTPTFVFHSYIKGGLTEENSSNNGIYHLLSALLTKGHSDCDYDKLKSFLEDRSAHMNGFSGKNAYGITLHGQSEHTQDLFSHFMHSLTSPKIMSKHLKHEKEMSIRALDNQQEDPVKQCFHYVSKLMFGKHPYSLNMLGSVKSLKAITKKKIEDLHNKNLKNKEILFTYSGDLDLEEVVEYLSPFIEKLKPREEKKIIEKKFTPAKGEKLFIPFDREQTQIFLGLPGPKLGMKENIYLKMLTTHLSGQSSELFVEVRDRQGLCYATQPVHFSALEGGFWGIYLASGHDKVDAAISAIQGILDKVKESGLTKEEFDRVKKMIEGQSLINVQTNEDYANIYSVPTLQGLGMDSYHKNNDIIKNLSYEEFQKSIKKFFNRKLNTIIVGRE